MDDIRQAKIEAAERVIEDRLRAKGLLPPDESTYQCDACNRAITEDERRGGIRGGGEGTFCPECCGETQTTTPSDFEQLQFQERLREAMLANPLVSEIDLSIPTPTPETAGEWRVIETRYSCEIAIDDNLRLRAHWTGLRKSEDLREMMQQIVIDHNAVAFARRSGHNWTLIDWQNWLQWHAKGDSDAE